MVALIVPPADELAPRAPASRRTRCGPAFGAVMDARATAGQTREAKALVGPDHQGRQRDVEEGRQVARAIDAPTGREPAFAGGGQGGPGVAGDGPGDHGVTSSSWPNSPWRNLARLSARSSGGIGWPISLARAAAGCAGVQELPSRHARASGWFHASAA